MCLCLASMGGSSASYLMATIEHNREVVFRKLDRRYFVTIVLCMTIKAFCWHSNPHSNSIKLVSFYNLHVTLLIIM